MVASSVNDIANAYQQYLATAESWQQLVGDITPKHGDCGLVYEIPQTPLTLPASLAIADMRELRVSGAHYHAGDETEIYIVLEGYGTVAVGGRMVPVQSDSVVVTPPNTAHFTVSHGLVLGVVNTPPFNTNNYVPLTATNPAVGYDHDQLLAFTAWPT